MSRFLPVYFRALGEYVADEIEPQRLAREVWQATEALLRDGDPRGTVAEKFYRAFLPEQPELRDRLYPRFERFYAEVFDGLRAHAPQRPHALSVVEAVRAMGLRVALATNPVFPEAAVRRRMAWAGLDRVAFELVTTMEHMHTCKPQLSYYREIADRLGVPPAACLMVGNDRDEDMIASRLGMRTYWVTDLPLDRGESGVMPDGQGPLSELVAWLADRLAKEAAGMPGTSGTSAAKVGSAGTPGSGRPGRSGGVG